MANLAWMLATEPQGAARDAARSLQLVEGLLRASGEDPDWLDTAAVTLAALGRFDEAIVHCERAIELHRARGASDKAAELDERLAGFRDRRPFVHRAARERL